MSRFFFFPSPVDISDVSFSLPAPGRLKYWTTCLSGTKVRGQSLCWLSAKKHDGITVEHVPVGIFQQPFRQSPIGPEPDHPILSRSRTVSHTGPPDKTSTYSTIASLPKSSKRSSRYDRRTGSAIGRDQAAPVLFVKETRVRRLIIQRRECRHRPFRLVIASQRDAAHDHQQQAERCSGRPDRRAVILFPRCPQCQRQAFQQCCQAGAAARAKNGALRINVSARCSHTNTWAHW